MAYLGSKGVTKGLDRSGFCEPSYVARNATSIGMGRMGSGGLGSMFRGGLGRMGSGGLGYFTSGLDFSQWGLWEWATVGGAALFLFGGTMFGGRKLGRRRRTKRVARASKDAKVANARLALERAMA